MSPICNGTPLSLTSLPNYSPRILPVRRNLKGWFPKGWFWRMFVRNENRNEGTFRCSLGTKRTRVGSHVPPERKLERGYIRQNHPFAKPPFYLPVTCNQPVKNCTNCAKSTIPIEFHPGNLWSSSFPCREEHSMDQCRF